MFLIALTVVHRRNSWRHMNFLTTYLSSHMHVSYYHSTGGARRIEAKTAAVFSRVLVASTDVLQGT